MFYITDIMYYRYYILQILYIRYIIYYRYYILHILYIRYIIYYRYYILHILYIRYIIIYFRYYILQMCLDNLTYIPDIVSLLHSIPILYYNYHASVRIWNYSEIYIVLVYNIIMSCSKREIGIRTCFKIFECIYTMYIMNIIVCHSAVFSGL